MTDPILEGRLVAILDRVDALVRHLRVPGYVPDKVSPQGTAERFQAWLEEQHKQADERDKALERERAALGKTDEVDDEDRERLGSYWML